MTEPMPAWAKWRADLSGTKTQLGLLGALLIVAATARGLWVAQSAQDVATVVGALWPAWAALLAAWTVPKVQEIRTNGGVTK